MSDVLPTYATLLLLLTVGLAACRKREYKPPPPGDRLYNAGMTVRAL
jgi:hypothetical protein